LKRTGLDY